MSKETDRFDIVALGECLIDFVPSDSQTPDSIAFLGCPGGAPANVLVAASRLGLRTAFIGKVGTDVFGTLLKEALEKNGVDTSSLIQTDDYPTTLAFVALDASGDRSFSFYRTSTADVMLGSDEIDAMLLGSAPLFHFGSVSMTAEPSRSATLHAVGIARDHGALISFDPNLRELLWECANEAKQVITATLPLADLVKLSEEELAFLTDTDDIEAAMHQLSNAFPMKLLVVSRGSQGSIALNKNGIVEERGFRADVVDTVGAGDAFWGALLSRLHRHRGDIEDIDCKTLAEMLAYANAAGAISVTKPGAIGSLPDEAAIATLLQSRS